MLASATSSRGLLLAVGVRLYSAPKELTQVPFAQVRQFFCPGRPHLPEGSRGKPRGKAAIGCLGASRVETTHSHIGQVGER